MSWDKLAIHSVPTCFSITVASIVSRGFRRIEHESALIRSFGDDHETTVILLFREAEKCLARYARAIFAILSGIYLSIYLSVHLHFHDPQFVITSDIIRCPCWFLKPKFARYLFKLEPIDFGILDAGDAECDSPVRSITHLPVHSGTVLKNALLFGEDLSHGAVVATWPKRS